MDAKITYAIRYVPHPYDKKQRAEGVHAWALLRVVTVAESFRPISEETVAIFNWDSEAEIFMTHVLSAGLDGKLVDVDPDFRELQKLRAKNRAYYEGADGDSHK